MSEKQQEQKRVIATEKWRDFKNAVKTAFKLLVFIGFIYWLYKALTIWVIYGAIIGGIISFPFVWWFLEPPKAFLHVVDLDNKEIALYKIPKDVLKQFKVKGDFLNYLRSKKGEMVLFADKADLDKKTIEYAWIHKYANIYVLAKLETFKQLKDDASDIFEKYSRLTQAFIVMLKRYGAKVMRKWFEEPLLKVLEKTEIVKELSEKEKLEAEQIVGEEK